MISSAANLVDWPVRVAASLCKPGLGSIYVKSFHVTVSVTLCLFVLLGVKGPADCEVACHAAVRGVTAHTRVTLHRLFNGIEIWILIVAIHLAVTMLPCLVSTVHATVVLAVSSSIIVVTALFPTKP